MFRVHIQQKPVPFVTSIRAAPLSPFRSAMRAALDGPFDQDSNGLLLFLACSSTFETDLYIYICVQQEVKDVIAELYKW